MHAIQEPDGGAVADGGSAQPKVEQLRERDDAVLGERELHDPQLQRGVWFETLTR